MYDCGQGLSFYEIALTEPIPVWVVVESQYRPRACQESWVCASGVVKRSMTLWS
jgi:hypothetical protein